ncbi:MAG TPA: hypothetical protein VMV01_02575, partial [Planctomycetota bacterium]|nr:hypothetical protein [Planctomycetota bacterium]
AAAARALGLLLRSLAEDQPLAVLVDNGHYADESSLDAFELATLAEASAPLWIVIAARPRLGELRPGLGQRAGAFQRVELGPLVGEEAEALLRRLLEPAEGIPQPVILRLVERTRGIPLVMVELARGLARDGLIQQHAKGGTHYLATDGRDLPDLPLVEWLEARELASLPPELHRFAGLLSLLGAEIDVGEVSGVLHELDRAAAGDELDLDAGVGVDRLVQRGVLIRGAGGLRFRSDAMREALGRAVPAPLAAAIHQAAYQLHSRDPRSLAALARHAGPAGHGREGFDAYLLLARDADDRHTYLDAEVFYSRALELAAHAEPADRLAVARRGRGLMRFRLFRFD